MLKKFCLLVIILIFVSGSACAADLRAEMQFIIHQKNAESAVTAEALIREKEIMLISGLFPSYAFSFASEGVSLPDPADINDSAFDLLSPHDAMETLSSFFQMLNPETYEGVFAGELFDNAALVSKGQISVSDLLPLSAGYAQTENKQIQNMGPEKLMGNFSVLSEMSELSGLMIKYSSYDNGKYLSFNGIEGEKTLFTVSCDCSASDAVKTVAGYASGGKNYYWDSVTAFGSPNEITFTSSLFADNLKQGYRNIIKENPVVTENWTVQMSKDRKETVFSGMILPANNHKPVVIEGSFSMDKHTVLMMKASFKDWEESYFTLSVRIDESPVNTEGLKMIPLNNQADLSEAESAFTEISANGIPIMLKIIMALPDEYQDYFLSLMK